MAAGIDDAELDLLAETFRKTMSSASGPVLDRALGQLGWRDLLAEFPATAVPLTFRLLGETGAHAPLLNDVLLTAAGREPGGTVPLPYAGGSWVVWERTDQPSAAIDGQIPLRRLTAGRTSHVSTAGSPLADSPLAGSPLAGSPLARDGWAMATGAAALTVDAAALAAGRRAVGWWLLGTGRAMLALARAHAVDRVQFGRPIASFQAVRHRLAETFVALDGAEAVLAAAEEQGAPGELTAADGQAAADGRTAADARAAANARAAADGRTAGPGNGINDVELASLLAKAAAGQAALTAARHCQQVLGGIGFTAEHALHIHVKRALLLDGLLGSARELTREAGRRLIAEGTAPRLVEL